MRTQLDRMELKNLDGVLFSTRIMTMLNGIDDLRVLAYHSKKLIEVYGSPWKR